jgi:hypothetical protein
VRDVWFIDTSTASGRSGQLTQEPDLGELPLAHHCFGRHSKDIGGFFVAQADWLIAANLSTTIPSSINPLSLLPVKIPVKLFFDIGTYAEAWKQGSEADRFLYDAGIHIPLFRETINIYIPLLYSSVYRDYIQSTILKKERFWKKISFSIDISNFSFRKIDRNLNF